ncbi:hypothetical protein L325_0122465 [Yersinia pestis 9]|nr:hypothetical protein L325_0122465 [Yersinia pestis 9]
MKYNANITSLFGLSSLFGLFSLFGLYCAQGVPLGLAIFAYREFYDPWGRYAADWFGGAEYAALGV